MSKELVISATSHERRVAILEEGQLVEIYIEREKEFALVGSIYKGKVTRVLPGMQSAFVDIGLDGDAFLYVSDVFENLEDYDHGHGHGDIPAASGPVNRVTTTIDLLPGESRGGVGSHAEGGADDEAPSGHELPGELLAGEEHLAESARESEEQGLRGQPSSSEQEVSEIDERQPESNDSAPQNFAPSYNPTRNYPPRHGSDRGDRGADRGERGDRGGDRGRGGRPGRVGRGGRGGDRRRHGQGGRNLPPSKYASPQGGRDSRGSFEDRRSHDRGPSGPPPSSGEDDIVLPGESLAKYRGRPQQAPPPRVEQEPEERQPNFEQPVSRPAIGMQPPAGGPRRVTGSVPNWWRGDNEAEAEAASDAIEEHEADAAETVEHHEEETHAEVHRNGTAGLSDEELTALSSRLVEAKHDETQARADADTLVGGADFEEEAEEEDETEELAEEEHEEHDEEEEAHEAEAEIVAAHDAEIPEEIHEHHEEEHEEEPRGLSEAERADLAHEEALEAVEAEAAMSAAAGGDTAGQPIQDDEVGLLPGETRSQRDPNAPREEFAPRRDSARIGSDPRSRFQRPHRGGDRGRGRHDRRGGDRGGRGGFRRRGGGDPGGDHHHGHGGGHHRGHHGGHAPQRRPQLISEMLKPGQDVVVQ